MNKKIISIAIVFVMLFGFASAVSAYSGHRTPGSTAYTTSQMKTTGAGTYGCRLYSITSGTFTGGNYVNMRIRRTSDNAKAGDMASFSSTVSSYYYYNYWYGFGDLRQYKLAIDDNLNKDFYFGVYWTPDGI